MTFYNNLDLKSLHGMDWPRLTLSSAIQCLSSVFIFIVGLIDGKFLASKIIRLLSLKQLSKRSTGEYRRKTSLNRWLQTSGRGNHRHRSELFESWRIFPTHTLDLFDVEKRCTCGHSRHRLDVNFRIVRRLQSAIRSRLSGDNVWPGLYSLSWDIERSFEVSVWSFALIVKQ